MRKNAYNSISSFNLPMRYDSCQIRANAERFIRFGFPTAPCNYFFAETKHNAGMAYSCCRASPRRMVLLIFRQHNYCSSYLRHPRHRSLLVVPFHDLFESILASRHRSLFVKSPSNAPPLPDSTRSRSSGA